MGATIYGSRRAVGSGRLRCCRGQRRGFGRKELFSLTHWECSNPGSLYPRRNVDGGKCGPASVGRFGSGFGDRFELAGDRRIYRFGRELLGAILNGAIAGAILASLIFVGSLIFDVDDPIRLTLETSMYLLTVTTIAATVGSFVPLALDRLGIDPAATTGVFITTRNDLVGVQVYFLMASAF